MNFLARLGCPFTFMKKFLVTGATGFLGTHLVDALLRRFADCSDLTSIRILSRGGNPWKENPRIEVFHGDILNAGAVDRAVESVSGIFHLAGFVTRNPANGADLYQTHVQGTRNICESALAHGGPRVVVVSSSGTIAVSRQPKIHNEDSLYSNDVVAFWPYYLSKIYQEKLALSYHALKELPVVIVNPSLLLGPRDERFSSTGDVRLFLAGKVTNIPFGGLNFVDVRDAAQALIQAMLAGLPGRPQAFALHGFRFPRDGPGAGRACCGLFIRGSEDISRSTTRLLRWPIVFGISTTRAQRRNWVLRPGRRKSPSGIPWNT